MVEIKCTSQSGFKHCLQNSKCLNTVTAFAVVVVITKWFSENLAVVPSSKAIPSSLSINPYRTFPTGSFPKLFAYTKLRKAPESFPFISILPSVVLSKVPSQQIEISKHINSFVREGYVPHPQEMYAQLDAKYKGEVNVHTFKSWHLISQLKQRLLDAIVVNDNVKCYIDGESSDHEGYVIVSDNPYKIVDRLTFSKANFNLNKNWTNEKV